jgi:hypothetical protein
MKHIKILGFTLCVVMLMGCFKDKGNYDYAELNAPTWLFNNLSTPIYITTYAGDTARAKVPFQFEKDSVKMLANSRFEWKFNDVLLSEERDFNMPTDQLIAKLNLSFSEPSGSSGSFSIIDKTTGVKHMVRTWVTIRPKFYQGDWAILSESAGNSKLSFYKKKTRTGLGGVTTTTYTLSDNLYETVNGSKLLGAPRKLRYSQARDISAPVGATSVITDQSAYVVNNENFKLVSEYKNEFLDGTPPNFKVSNIFHSRLLAYLATDDGKLYRRVLTPNWLGGKFLTQPYVIDNKGYKITDFGFGKTAQTSAISPAYDELNRRVVMIQMVEPYRILPVTLISGTVNPTPVWEMPEGTEVLYLGASSHKDYPQYSAGLFTMVYNDKNGNTFLSDFVVNWADARVLENPAANKIPFPGGNLPKGTKFLGTADTYRKDYLFYTKGNELRYVNRINDSSNSYMTFTSNITDVKYAAYNINYKQISLGFENGDFFMVDISVVSLPKIMPQTKVNVGGKIVDIMELRIDSFTDAY